MTCPSLLVFKVADQHGKQSDTPMFWAGMMSLEVGGRAVFMSFLFGLLLSPVNCPGTMGMGLYLITASNRHASLLGGNFHKTEHSEMGTFEIVMLVVMVLIIAGSIYIDRHRR